MIKPSAPRLAIVLIVLSMSFCTQINPEEIDISSADARLRSKRSLVRTHLREKIVSAILILEPVIDEDLLFAGTLLRYSQRLRHSALHKAHPIALLDLLSQVHRR